MLGTEAGEAGGLIILIFKEIVQLFNAEVIKAARFDHFDLFGSCDSKGSCTKTTICRKAQ